MSLYHRVKAGVSEFPGHLITQLGDLPLHVRRSGPASASPPAGTLWPTFTTEI